MTTRPLSKFFLLTIVVTALVTVQLSCPEDEPMGAFTIEFQGVAGDQQLELERTILLAPDQVQAFTLSRLSFYLSDITLIDTDFGADSVQTLESVAFVELDARGFASLRLEPNNRLFTPEFIQFRLGLSDEQDASTPVEYDAGHPLARTSEYWVDWGSYIFLKIEGRADTINDDRTRFDSPILYHLGRSPDLARTMRIPLNPDVQGTTQRLRINVYDLLGISSGESISLRGAIDHQNQAGQRIMNNAARAFRAE